ncbi:short tail fiber [Citrobacter phage CkP1]|nr:short tail fiber [Citrobacter phage CkP1]
MSILSTKAGVKSRLADYLQFETKNSNDVMSKQPYGSITISQLAKGVDYDNVQSAIDDVRNFSIKAINTIEINTDGVSPEGSSQTDTWVFEGTVSNSNGTTDDSMINVFGFNVLVSDSDTADEVADKVKLVLDVAVANNFVINSVVKGANPGELEVNYIDNQTHELSPTYANGIKITQTILSPAKEGYGAWIRIGTKTETLDGAAEPVLLHYFKRIA